MSHHTFSESFHLLEALRNDPWILDHTNIGLKMSLFILSHSKHVLLAGHRSTRARYSAIERPAKTSQLKGFFPSYLIPQSYSPDPSHHLVKHEDPLCPLTDNVVTTFNLREQVQEMFEVMKNGTLATRQGYRTNDAYQLRALSLTSANWNPNAADWLRDFTVVVLGIIYEKYLEPTYRHLALGGSMGYFHLLMAEWLNPISKCVKYVQSIPGPDGVMTEVESMVPEYQFLDNYNLWLMKMQSIRSRYSPSQRSSACTSGSIKWQSAIRRTPTTWTARKQSMH